ncbi:hypothetical protein ACHAXR_013566 [Thalassiosira sp. AJA248-18]
MSVFLHGTYIIAGLALTSISIASGFSTNHIDRNHLPWSSYSALYSDDSQPFEEDFYPLSDNVYPHFDRREWIEEFCPLSGNVYPHIDRREWIKNQVLASSAIILGKLHNANAEEGNKDGTKISNKVPQNKAVIVLGANGGTGRECVSAILAAGRPCVATTRSGKFEYDEGTFSNEDAKSSPLLRSNQNIQEGQADVTKLESLLSLVDQNGNKNIGAMIFAASASVKGKDKGVNDAFAVDYQGVINAAQCCIQRNIPRLVIVSSGAVTRPNSPVYKLLNFVGSGIMEAKIQGEDAVRDLYHDNAVMDRGLGYTIVRPGGLTPGESLGPAFLEVNQGDDKSGRLSRADVAGICVASLDVASAFDATFECYELNTAKPVENVGLSNVLRLIDPTSYKSGREGTGETWDALLGGLKSDFV